jgi:hypothetical protein
LHFRCLELESNGFLLPVLLCFASCIFIFELSFFFLVGELRFELTDLSHLSLTIGSNNLVKTIPAAAPDLPDRQISVSSLSASWRPSSPITSLLAFGICTLVVNRSRSNKEKDEDLEPDDT